MQLHTFPASNGFKEHDVLDPRFGRLRIAFSVPSTVTGGLLQVDYKFAGSDQWRTYYAGASANMGKFRLIDLNLLDVFIGGEVSHIRTSLSGVVGSGDIAMAVYNDEMSIPWHLLTNGGGRNARLRVDPDQTGFWDGREFRSFKELNIGAGLTYVCKIVVPVNVILHSALLTIDAGSLRFSSQFGGTEGGTFSETLPVIPKNRMTTIPQLTYASQVAITAGGTHAADGTLFDVVRLVAPNGQSVSVSAVGEGDDAMRGVAPGTYYFLFQNIAAGAVTGVFKLHWEERP